MDFTLLPQRSALRKFWSPKLVFTGVSIMGINPSSGARPTLYALPLPCRPAPPHAGVVQCVLRASCLSCFNRAHSACMRLGDVWVQSSVGVVVGGGQRCFLVRQPLAHLSDPPVVGVVVPGVRPK